MKLKNYFLMAILAFAATACSDDDDNNNATTPSQNIAGSYSGYAEAAFQYTDTPLVSTDQTVKVETSADNSSVTVSYTSADFGEFTVSGANVTYANGTYSISGNGSTLMGMGDTKNEYDCTLSGSLNDAKTEGTFTFTVPSVMGGMTITFTLGEAPVTKVLAGSYEGWTNASCAMFDNMKAADQTIKLTANEDGTMKLEYTSDTWGEFTFNALTATSENGAYTLSGEGSTMMGMGGNVNEYPCTVEGNINGDKSEVSFVFNIPAVMGGLTIAFTLGDAPAE